MAYLNTEHCDLLYLASQAHVGPQLPAPPLIENSVASLLERGLLKSRDGRAEITDAGREALAANTAKVSLHDPEFGAQLADELSSHVLDRAAPT